MLDNLPKYSFIVVLCLNIVIIAVKAFVYFGTGSIAVFSSLTDSVFDLVVSAVNSLALIYALKPKDDDHKFGHAAIEDVMALMQVFLIFASGIVMFYNTIVMHSVGYSFSWAHFWLMAGNVIPLLMIIFVQMYSQKRTKSTIVAIDLLHYSTDFVALVGVMLAMILTYITGIIWFDIICGVLIVLAIACSCFGGIRQALNNLMAKEVDKPTLDCIVDILDSSKDIVGYRDLRTRRSGHMCFVNVDIILPRNTSLVDAHIIAHKLEDKIKEKVLCDIVIHMEPDHLPS